MFAIKRFGALAALLGLVAFGVAALPGQAEAWWRGGCCGVGVGIWLPPIVVAPPVDHPPPPVDHAPPPVYYAAPPGYYAPPRRAWIPGHSRGPYWVPGHWS